MDFHICYVFMDHAWEKTIIYKKNIAAPDKQ